MSGIDHRDLNSTSECRCFGLCMFTSLLSHPDLISHLMEPLADPWLDQETYYNFIPVPESYTGPHLSFPLSVSDTNTLLAAFKEHKVMNESPVCSNSVLIFWFTVIQDLFSLYRLYTPGIFYSCSTRPNSFSNGCPTSSTCRHPA